MKGIFVESSVQRWMLDNLHLAQFLNHFYVWAHLPVTALFFGPFYGAYGIFELDAQNYQYAMISGPDTSYLWLLARSPVLDAATQQRLVARADALGFDTGQLIFVKHD